MAQYSGHGGWAGPNERQVGTPESERLPPNFERAGLRARPPRSTRLGQQIEQALCFGASRLQMYQLRDEPPCALHI